MIIDCIAVLHGHKPKLKGGDMLIVAGDLTAKDRLSEYDDFLDWMQQQQYTKKILIAGNHDNILQTAEPAFFECLKNDGIDYLQDSGMEFEGLKIWGSPWTPLFKGVNPHCKAFMRSDEALFDKWQLIPGKIDLLITHGPAYGILDGVTQDYDGTLYHCGCHSLYNFLKYVERPAYHIFGHIHEAYGAEEYFPTYNDKMMQSINCSYVDGKYRPVNKPIRIKHEKV